MKLIIFGTSDIARCAYEYFTHDSDYDVVGFSVDEAYLEGQETYLNLPLVPFESVDDFFSPQTHHFFVAIGSQKLNRLRADKCEAVKQKGYKLASYISSKAFVWPNVIIGEHAFILEDNTLQPHVKIGNNVTLWSGNHIGHSAIIEDHCFITSHVVVSGLCNIGKYSFLGVNSAVADTVRVGCDNFISMGANVTQNTEDNVRLSVNKNKLSSVSARTYCQVSES